MFSSILLMKLATAVTILTVIHGNSMDKVPYSGESTNTNALLDQEVSLSCNASSLEPGDEIQFWIRPDSTVMNKGDREEFKILDGYAGWEVSADGMEMMIHHVQERHFGVYICVYKEDNSGSTIAAHRGLNVDGAYFGDLWEVYEKNTIIGLSAAGGFLVLAAIVGITYKFRYEAPKDKDDCSSSASSADGQELPVIESTSYAYTAPEVPILEQVNGGYFNDYDASTTPF